jgi:hypothetical protein
MPLFIILVLLLSGCAGGARADRPGLPQDDPPRLSQEGPPPAWIETADESRWLAYGSYCWTTLCVDMIPPTMRDDVPVVAIRRGDSVRVHLGFVPRTAGVLVLDRSRTLPLEPERVLEWRPQNASGVVMIDARSVRGSASYLFTLRVRS